LGPIGPPAPVGPFILTGSGFSRDLSFVQERIPSCDISGVKVAPSSPFKNTAPELSISEWLFCCFKPTSTLLLEPVN
jgi:hypothetical protein